ncbi:MAG: RDD family protein [Gammaproteobacteria bacterium]|nr:RDD family protein [Gammaproteobacteria bacterium]
MSHPKVGPGLGRRLAAIAYDSLLVAALLFAATALVLPLTGGEAVRPNHPLYTAYLLAVMAGYFGWCWTHGGQTLGMRAWHLRVVGLAGEPIGWRRALARFAAAALSLAPFAAGFAWAMVDSERLAWHDRLSGTRLVDARGS